MAHNTTRRGKRLVALLASVPLAAGLTLAGAPAAQSASTFITSPNGMVGLAQEITVKAPRAARNQPIVINLAGASGTSQLQTVVNAQGFANVSWVPSAPGSWTISGTGNIASIGSTTINVSAMPTTTTLSVPNLIQVGVPSNAIVTVSAPLGAFAPTGVVTVRSLLTNNVVAQGSLVPAAGSTFSTATLPFTPVGTGSYPMVATYAPATGAFTASTSPNVSPALTGDRVNVALRTAPTIYAGQPVAMSAVLGPNVPDGSVAYILNGIGITGSMPTNGGVETFLWTPAAAGIQTMLVTYSGPPGWSGASSQQFNVLPPLPNDTLAVTPAGGSSWPVGSPIPVRAGTSISLTGSAASGAVVVLSETGPCVLNGATMTALSAGTCILTATSPGSASFKPATATYTITVTAPPRRPRR